MGLFEHDYPVPESISPRLQMAWRQLEFVRNYTLTLIDDLADDEWYYCPPEFTTHIAWQMGHVAMAQYGLTLFRQRGRLEVDSELMSGRFRKLFLRGSEPRLNRELYPAPGEILEVLHKVHQHMRTELPGFDGAQLDAAVESPHAAFGTRLGALLFAAQHEMLHAGQAGMLRRMMGKPPLR